MILHIPHASTDIGDVSYNISGDDLKKELFESTDWFTDELFIHSKSFPIIFNKSRLYIDVERFNDERETMEHIGRGIKYTRTFHGEVLKKNTNYSIEAYLEHHKKLKYAVNQMLHVKKKVYIVDCHSFNNEIATDSPDVCLGYNDENCDLVTLDKIAKIFQNHGYRVQIKICTKADTDSLSKLNSAFPLALNHSSSSSYINLLL